MTKGFLSLLLLVAALRAQPEGACAFERAVQLHRAGDLPGAMRDYQACIAAEPGRVDARSNLGAVLAQQGRYQEAIEQYRQALKLAGPGVAPSLHRNLALAYYKSIQIPEAVAELEPLHALDPADLNVALLLGDCYLRSGEFAKAIQLLAPFDSPQGGREAVDYVLGMALLRAGRTAEGQLHVDRILRRGESAEAHLMLGWSLFSAGNYPAAVPELSKAAALNPNLPSLQSYYGQALLFTGDADSAAEAFRKELAANPNDYDANFQLASILAHRGNPDEARLLLERAVRIRPGSAQARKALEHGFGSDAPKHDDTGIAVSSPAPAIPSFDPSHLARPVVLVFGSYTCPKLRYSAADLKHLYAQYKGRLDFRLVYIREAHATGGSETQWQSTINEKQGISLPPARDMTEKRAHADLCVRKLALPFPIMVDGLDGGAENAYAAWPSRVYLIDRAGRVAFDSRLGELDLKPSELEGAIRAVLARKGPGARTQ